MDPVKKAGLPEWGPVAVSMTAMLVFVAAIVVAYITRDPSLAILLGMAGANGTQVVNYWLGSSSGSAKKDQMLADKTPAP